MPHRKWCRRRPIGSSPWDTFGENYHFDVLHRKTLSKDIRGNLQTHDIFGRNYRMVFALVQRFEELGQAALNLNEWPFRSMTLSVYFIYPNTIFLVDPGAVDCGCASSQTGDNPSRIAHRAQFLRHRKGPGPTFAGHRFEERFEGFNAVVQHEDYAMGSVYAALRRGRPAERGVVSGANEPALLHLPQHASPRPLGGHYWKQKPQAA